MWQFEGMKDGQLVTSDWLPANHAVIEGVRLRQMSNVLSDNGRLTELWRRDWELDGEPVDQVFQKVMAPGDLSAWHAHRLTTDRLFCGYGHVKLVLYDARTASATRGRLMELRMGATRPALAVIPPGVWHGVQALSGGPAIITNLVDQAYCYEDPDHWRLPPECDEIPYRFDRAAP